MFRITNADLVTRANATNDAMRVACRRFNALDADRDTRHSLDRHSTLTTATALAEQWVSEFRAALAAGARPVDADPHFHLTF